MQRIGQEAVRLFKALAGQDRDEPMSAFVIALYGLLFLVALTLVVAWITGTPLECMFRATC